MIPVGFVHGMPAAINLNLSRYPFGSISRTWRISLEEITCFFRSERFLLRVFLVRIWLALDLENMNFPVPVRLKRLAAARFVLIFGIVYSFKEDSPVHEQNPYFHSGAVVKHINLHHCFSNVK